MVTESGTYETLSCREAELLLRVIPLDKERKDMKPEEVGAVEHYYNLNPGCKPCRERGIRKILQREISCQGALETCANNPGPLYLSGIRSLKELLAVEHVWGRWIPRDEGSYHFQIESCKEKPCFGLRYFWINTPLSSAYNGEKEVAEEIPFLIKVFRETGWPLENILNIQSRRIEEVLEKLTQERKRSSFEREMGFEVVNDRGTYALHEVNANLDILQQIVLDSYQK